MLTSGTEAQHPHIDCTSAGSRRGHVADTPALPRPCQYQNPYL